MKISRTSSRKVKPKSPDEDAKRGNNDMDMVEVLGKKNRKVPVLMTPNMLAAVNALVSTRETVGIPKENPFVFAVGETGHLRGCATIKRIVESCTEDIKYPELITSTKLRKYMATVSQVFNLSNGQLEELARHMGHELSVHRQFYRLQEDVVELAKVSKLLLTVEKGKAHQFIGMSLDDIQLDGPQMTKRKACYAEPEKHRSKDELGPQMSQQKTCYAEPDECRTEDDMDFQGRPCRHKQRMVEHDYEEQSSGDEYVLKDSENESSSEEMSSEDVPASRK